MKPCRFPVLSIMLLCISIFLSILVVGFAATAAQASDEVIKEKIVGTIQQAEILGDFVEGTQASWTVTNVSDDEEDEEREEENDKEEGEGPVVIDDPFDPCYGCWDY